MVIVMQSFCYILYSDSIDRYYVGYTSDIQERIKLHNNGHFGGKSFTHKATDWSLFLLIPCKSIQQAIFIESKIKRMKSRRFIENLKKYPEIVEKILNAYK
jgi:putative endonuclease